MEIEAQRVRETWSQKAIEGWSGIRAWVSAQSQNSFSFTLPFPSSIPSCCVSPGRLLSFSEPQWCHQRNRRNRVWKDSKDILTHNTFVGCLPAVDAYSQTLSPFVLGEKHCPLFTDRDRDPVSKAPRCGALLEDKCPSFFINKFLHILTRWRGNVQGSLKGLLPRCELDSDPDSNKF